MRLTTSHAPLIGFAGLIFGFAVASAQAPRAKVPSIDELRQAVASLEGGRIPRPSSCDVMTAEQKAFVISVLGPRGDISGSLAAMIVSPAFADLAQKAIAYARFAGHDGYSVVPPKLSELAIIGARAVLGGDRGGVDLIGTLGMYQVVAMMMVVDEFPMPDGVVPELKAL
jgi:hypothetical protein